MIDRILVQRATVCVQQWWKNRKLRARLFALAEISSYLKRIESKTVYIEESVYLNLERICDTVRSYSTFPEQNIHFDIKDKGVKAVVDPSADPLGRYSEYAVPFWMLLNLNSIK